jgi:hypothetical protein
VNGVSTIALSRAGADAGADGADWLRADDAKHPIRKAVVMTAGRKQWWERRCMVAGVCTRWRGCTSSVHPDFHPKADASKLVSSGNLGRRTQPGEAAIKRKDAKEYEETPKSSLQTSRLFASLRSGLFLSARFQSLAQATKLFYML